MLVCYDTPSLCVNSLFPFAAEEHFLLVNDVDLVLLRLVVPSALEVVDVSLPLG